MVSSLIGVQYNNDQFWKFSAAAAAGEANNFDTPSVPTFSSTFEVRKTSKDFLAPSGAKRVTISACLSVHLDIVYLELSISIFLA